MTKASDDTARVKGLAELALLDNPLDPVIERTCALAAEIFGKRFAFVTLADETQAHIYAHRGLASVSIPRGDAFCDITIRQQVPLVVSDTRNDIRFQASPLVLKDPKIRFYAGIPLELGTEVCIGAFCVADTEPSTLSDEQFRMLRDFASIVADQITRHASKQNLARQAMAMASQQAILHQTERFAGVGGFQADLDNGTMVWSDGLHRLFETTGLGVVTIDAFVAYFNIESQKQIRAGFDTLENGGAEFDLEAEVLTDHLSRLFVHVHAERRSTAGLAKGVVGIVQDITERRSAIAELRRIATHDALTRLLNRSAFNAALDEAISRSQLTGSPVSLFMLDVDRFKTINDTLGHDAGDAVLVTVAQRLKEALGEKGVVARIGGDEFALLVNRFDAEGEIAALATRVLLALRRPFIFRGVEVSTRATFGIAIAERKPRSASDLFKDADLALYNAKQAGRDGFAFYRSSMRHQLEGRLSRLAVARAAIHANQFEPFYQPKICLETGAISGFEALLRWYHPQDGLSGPAEMAEAFEDTDLAVEIGRGMIDKIVADLAGWRHSGLTVGHVAINVAEPEFHAGDYADILLSRLEAEGLSTDSIEIEVTECVFLGQRSGIVAMTLRKLADAGVRIALDDFGTGYASLTHLKQHPVTAIKIDRSFVADVESDASAATIVDALTSLANSLRIDVVAEGIETAYQLDFLRSRACTMGQGYFFAKPMPAARVPWFIRNWAGHTLTDAAPRRATA